MLSQTKDANRDGQPLIVLTSRLALTCALAVLSVSCKGEAPTAAEPRTPPPPAPAPAPRAVPAVEPKAVIHTPPSSAEFAPGIVYTNHVFADIPWSIQVARVDRSHREFELHSAVAQGVICGLSTLSDVVQSIPPADGTPFVAVNGDFFQRDRAYAGDPRGLQIVDGDLISGPTGGAVFWIDAAGYPHAENVAPDFTVTFPDGSTIPFGLNEPRRPDAAVLYTASLGTSTRTVNGLEIVLEKAGNGPWFPLKIGEKFQARVTEVRRNPNTPLNPRIQVLSVGPVLATRLPHIGTGMLLGLSTASAPDLRGADTAIGGGPVLLHGGKVVEIERPTSLMAVPYSIRSMFERHPRTAMGWNDDYFYLVQIDGRQRDLSMGMTLAELADFMLTKLKCTHALNLDGGGSSTFWAGGRTRSSPCEGRERELANALLVVRKNVASKLAGAGGTASSATAATH